MKRKKLIYNILTIVCCTIMANSFTVANDYRLPQPNGYDTLTSVDNGHNTTCREVERLVSASANNAVGRTKQDSSQRNLCHNTPTIKSQYGLNLYGRQNTTVKQHQKNGTLIFISVLRI